MSRKRRIFIFPTSYIQGHVRGSRRVPPGLVCLRKKGTSERRKGDDQGRWSVASRRGREKVPEKVGKQKARKWLRKGKVPCVLNQEISFFGSRVLGF
jgi:hypothetical protein